MTVYGLRSARKSTFCYHCLVNPRIPLIIITMLLLLPAVSSTEDAEGASAPALKNPGLLITVEQGCFIKSNAPGVEMRGCPPFKDKTSSESIEAVASRMKSWQTEKLPDAPAHDVKAMYTEKDERLFALCGGCHGLEGEGAMGPPLLDPGFLASTSDTELRRTIMHGRPGTPMKGFLKGMGSAFAVLSPEEIDGIISYMRYRQAAGGTQDAERIKAP